MNTHTIILSSFLCLSSFFSCSTQDCSEYDGTCNPIVTWLLSQYSSAFYLKQIHSGSHTMSSTNEFVSIGKTIDLNRSFVFCSQSSSSANPGDFVACHIENSTTIRFIADDYSLPNRATVAWYILEFYSGLNVWRGSTTMNGGDLTANIALEDSINIASSFATIGARVNASGATDERKTIRPSLSTNQINLIRAEGGAIADVYWQVIQMDKASVQSGTVVLNAAETNKTVTISKINANQAFIIGIPEASVLVNGVDSEYHVRCKIQDSSTLSFERFVSTQPVTLNWFVIEIPGISVSRGQASNADPNHTLLTENIDFINIERSFPLISTSISDGASNTASLDAGAYRTDLQSNQLHLIREGPDGDNAIVNWEIISFPN